MGVESKIRELMEGSANRPKDKLTARDDKNPTQGDSNANPEQQDLSGTGNAEGGLTSTVGKAASAKAGKDTTLPAGNGAKEAPANFVNDKPSETDVMKKASAGNVAKEEAELDDEEVIVEDEAVEEDVEVVTEEEVEVEDEVAYEDDSLFEADLEALFAGDENLTEEFKTKAADIFEAVVTSRVANEVEAIEAELEEQANAEFESKLDEMVENIDKYLNYVTENWMKENELAVENGLRNEITESFIKGLQQVFTQHYIEVPEEKYDVMTEMQSKLDDLQTKLDEQVQKNIDLNEEAVALKKQSIFDTVSEDLADTDAEKFATMVEDISYTSSESYKTKLEVVKENYFRKESIETSEVLEDSVEEIALSENTNSIMSKYAQALSKSTKF
jgi:hypothetical protein